MILGYSLARELDPAATSQLLKSFPSLDSLLNHDGEGNYWYLGVSIFERWLGEEAFAAFEQPTTEQAYLEFAQPLFKFGKLLAETVDLIRVDQVPWNGSPWRLSAFDDVSEAAQHAQPLDWDRPSDEFFQVLIPAWSAVYVENWEFTNVFFLLDRSVEVQIRALANAAGAHVLERSPQAAPPIRQ